MNLQSPRNKLFLAAALLILLGGASFASGFSMSAAARFVLILCAGTAVIVWTRKQHGRARFALPERLQVLSRTGLSPRCGLALVEADGKSFLVAYGDGFAVIQSTRGAKRAVKPRLQSIEGGAR